MDAIELRRLRELPLESVLEGFGARRDPKDPRRNWRVDDHRITVSGDKFFDHPHEVGGGGALDLALHLLGRDPRRPSAHDLETAAMWLGAARLAHTPQPAPIADPATQPPPSPDLSRLPRVRWYLAHKRAIPAAIVDTAIARGAVFADRHANAVFRLHDDTGREIGYEKRGTYDHPFHAVHGDKGLFVTGRRDSGIAAFVESAIEALSYRALKGDVLAVSTTGNAVELPDRMARHLKARGFRIVAAFNADPDGDRFAQRFMNRLGGVERDRPAAAKDWNQLLQRRRDPERAGQGAQTPEASAFTR